MTANVTYGPIDVFRTGEHVPMSGTPLFVTSRDLHEIVSTYDAKGAPAPVVIGHPVADAPAYGWVDRLTVSGDKLTATLKDVHPKFAELVREGRYKKVSVSLFKSDAPNNPAPGKWYLKHVGFLGAAAPAVAGLDPVHFASGSAGVVSFGAEDGSEMPASYVRAMHRMHNDAHLEKVIGEGRLIPVFKNDLLSFMESIDNSHAVSFADGEKGPLDWFRSFLGHLPKVVHYGPVVPRHDPLLEPARGASVNAPSGYAVDDRGMDLHERTRRVAAERGISFVEALDIVQGGR